MLRIGHLSTLYHTSIFLMAQGNLDRLLGRPVQWQLYGTGPAIIQAFEREEIDMAYIGLPPVIIGIDRGVRIRCVAGGHIEGTVLASHENISGYPEISNLRDILVQFSGQRIGVPGRGSIHDVILTELLHRFKLSEEIGIHNFKWADQVLEAFVKGEIIAVAGTPALAVAVKRYGKGKIIYPPSILWPNNPSYGIVVSEKLLRDGREVIEKFLQIHEDATALLRDKPEYVSEVISSFIGIVEKDFALETIMLSPRYCAQLTEDYINATMEFVKAMKRLGYIKKNIERDDIFETEIIRAIHDSGDHY
ncbi:MAG: ABC transporter substrate-binding protein [Thermodesulfovibrionales bacterium]